MIYADENVWIPVAEGLRRRGWEVTTAVEAGTLGDSDREHLRFVAEEGWTLLTFDDDFLSMVKTREPEFDHAGIIYVSQHGKDVGELVRRVDRVLQPNADSDLTNEIRYA